MKKRVVVLGATGSIGQNALSLIRNFPDEFCLAGFSYHANMQLSSYIKEEFGGALSLCTREISASETIESRLERFQQFLENCKADIVLNGIQGSSGLIPSYASLVCGLPLCLANKESIVMGYELLKSTAKKTNASIIPVDSEHWAIFQLLNMSEKEKIEKLIITASGGAFRDVPDEKLKDVRLKDAFSHPTWKMGAKITIDSASLANKALEVIEATKLFNFASDDVIVTVHKESIVHSMVQTQGGSIYAQLSPPDMKVPIFGALVFPNPTPKHLAPLDFSVAFSLHFAPPRKNAFPMLQMGFDVARMQGAYPIAFNAANEVAVEAFIEQKIPFVQIPELVSEVLQHDWHVFPCTLEEIYAIDRCARSFLAKWTK